MTPPRTIARVRTESVTALASAGIASPETEADWILTALLGTDRAGLHISSPDEFPASLQSHLDNAIRLRAAGHPLQYILGHTEFFSLPLRVTTDVLIPRPETERLVELVMEWLSGQPPSCEPVRLLDVGTGSGAIAIALAHARPDLHVTATDVSPAALRLARENASANNVDDRIDFVCCDILSPIRSEAGAAARFRAVVSNPPYIPTADLSSLPVDVADHEPMQALDGGQDGLAVIRPLAAQALPLLRPGGLVALEVDSRHATKTARVMDSVYGIGTTEIHCDLTGRPRVAMAVKPLAP